MKHDFWIAGNGGTKMEKYFMHRIQKENGVFSKGIEVHDTLDAAKLSFWGRMKLAYGNKAGITFVHCITK